MVPSSECWRVESSILRSVIWNWPGLVSGGELWISADT